MLDPAGDNKLLTTLRTTLDGVMQVQNAAILAQFSLDNHDGALVRFLGELTAKHGDLNQALSRDMARSWPSSAWTRRTPRSSRLVSRVETRAEEPDVGASLDNENSALQRLHRMFQDTPEHHAASATWSWPALDRDPEHERAGRRRPRARATA